MRTINHILKLCLTSLIAGILYLGCSKPVTPNTITAAKPTDEEKPTPQRIMVYLKTNSMVTTKAFYRTTPPPWPDGNSLSFRFREEPNPGKMETWVSWRVVNMHSENLHAIAKILKTDRVEMLILPITNYQSTMQDSASPARPILNESADALVTDSRISRAWFLEEPRNEQSRQLKTTYPDYFRSRR